MILKKDLMSVTDLLKGLQDPWEQRVKVMLPEEATWTGCASEAPEYLDEFYVDCFVAEKDVLKIYVIKE